SPPPHQVAEPPGKEQEARVRDQVAVDDPGQRALREVQVTLDGGERHVDDGHVDDDQQEASAEDDQGRAAVLVHASSDGVGAENSSAKNTARAARLNWCMHSTTRVAADRGGGAGPEVLFDASGLAADDGVVDTLARLQLQM